MRNTHKVHKVHKRTKYDGHECHGGWVDAFAVGCCTAYWKKVTCKKCLSRKKAKKCEAS